MCDFQVITTNSFGCIVRCNHCENLHIGFGNVLAVYELEEFQQLRWVVENLFIHNYADSLLSGEKVYINTDSEKVVFALHAEELSQLNTLLNEASVMLEVYTILENK